MLPFQWILNPMVCADHEISPGLDWNHPLIPHRSQVVYKIRLLLALWEDSACYGRLFSEEDFDLYEKYTTQLACALDENALRKVIEDVGRHLYAHLHLLSKERIEIPPGYRGFKSD